MKVKQLIAKLQKVKNQNAEVLVSSDGEGNHYGFLTEVATDFPKVLPSDGGEPEFWDEEDFPGEKCPKNVKDCVVLFP